VIPKYDFHPLITEKAREHKLDLNITPLASLIFQEASEKFIEEYHREMYFLQELGISHEISHHIFLSLFQIDTSNQLNKFESKTLHNPFLGIQAVEPVSDPVLDEVDEEYIFSESESSEDEREYIIEDDTQYDEVIYETNSSKEEIQEIVFNQKKRKTISRINF
jgi:hypothetical protein